MDINNTGDGSAKLFIVFLDDLANPVIIDTGVGNDSIACTAASNNCNGLSSPTLADVDGDFVVDRIYAGDVQGNMWSFDVSSNSVDDWDDSNRIVRLFTACRGATSSGNCDVADRQPITTAPQIQLHPSRRSYTSRPNILVYFGTGQYLATNDETDLRQQSFYAVWDTYEDITTSPNTLERGNLVEQSFTYDTSDSSFGITSNTVSYSDAVSGGVYGWYIDLETPSVNVFLGGRNVIDSILLGEIIFFVISVPEANTLSCTPLGSSFIVSLDALDGTEPSFPVFFDDDGDPEDPVLESEDSIIGLNVILDSEGKPKIIATTSGVDGDGNSTINLTPFDPNINREIAPGRKSWSIIR